MKDWNDSDLVLHHGEQQTDRVETLFHFIARGSIRFSLFSQRYPLEMRIRRSSSPSLSFRTVIVIGITVLLSFSLPHSTHASMRQVLPSQIQRNNMPGRQFSDLKSPTEMSQANLMSAPDKQSDSYVSKDQNDTPIQPPLAVLRTTSFLLMMSLALVMFSPASALMQQLGVDRATSLLSKLTAGAALVEVTLSPVLGSLIDSIGRKPVMTTSLVLLCLFNAIAAFHSSSIVAICLAKFVGLLGMSWFFISNQAVIGDVAAADPSKLSSVMGLQMALVGAGFFVGALAAGRLAEFGGLSLSYGSSAIVGSLVVALVALCMPETLAPSKRVPFHVPAARKMIKEAPLSCTRLLFKHGRQVQTLAIMLIFQALPMFMGDVMQVFAKQEWKLSTKEYSRFIALWSVNGIVANTAGSFLAQKLGIKRFMGLATLSSSFAPIGACLFGFRGAVMGSVLGFLGAAQSMGINSALVAQGKESGVPQGELAGERASLVAMLKVIGPLLYSGLYVEGRGKLGIPQLPFVFNICLAASAFVVSQLYLPSFGSEGKEKKDE